MNYTEMSEVGLNLAAQELNRPVCKASLDVLNDALTRYFGHIMNLCTAYTLWWICI